MTRPPMSWEPDEVPEVPVEAQETGREPLRESVEVLREVQRRAPKLEGTPTGVPGLDDLFFTTVLDEAGRPRRVSLKGFPRYAVIHLTGVSDTGKSLMAEQFALQQAVIGNSTVFVTVETPAPFLALSLRERAKAMGIRYEDVEDRIIIVDAASHAVLRDDLPTLLNTLAYAIRTYKAKNTVIDSVTGLYEAREMLARTIVRRLYNFMKKWYQTALLVSQKRSGHEELSAEAAGGYAVSHIVDGSIVLAKKTILSAYDERLYGIPLGEVVRLIRIDGCRMCGHDTATRRMEITETGLVVVRESLQEMTRRRRVGSAAEAAHPEE
jgi:KaiC domain protein